MTQQYTLAALGYPGTLDGSFLERSAELVKAATDGRRSGSDQTNPAHRR